MDVVKEINRANKARDPERLRLKYMKMRSDPFVFLRGACHLFYERLPSGGVFKNTPPVWSCGDLHIENFGSYKGDNRQAYFDINDFDEGALAPASWDLVRLLTSIRVGARSLGIRHRDAEELASLMLAHYAHALQEGKAYWVEHRVAQGLIARLLSSVSDRARKDFLAARTVLKGKRRLIHVDGRRALPASPEQKEQVQHFMHDFARQQTHPGFFKVLDVARRVAGTGSLGLDRYVILVQGKGSPDGHYLLDLKEAKPSCLAKHLKIKQPEWASPAHRVVEIQRRMQAVPMAFLQAVNMDDRPYLLRGLQPAEDRVSLDGKRHALEDIQRAVADMGQILAWSQLRSAGRQGSATADELIAFASGQKWRTKLQDVAQLMEHHTLEDAAMFGAAFDDGAFDKAIGA